jgi:hypothetical protein
MEKKGALDILCLCDEDKKGIEDLMLRVNSICEETGLDDAELLYLVRKASRSVPVGIFCGGCSPLEAIVRHLRDRGLSYSDIGRQLKRDPRVVWQTHRVAKDKLLGKADGLLVPLSVFSGSRLSILESLVTYLRQKRGLRLVHIAAILKKDTSTVATALKRAEMKGGLR